MDWGGPNFVLAIIAISTVGWIVNNWIRAKHGYELEDEWGGKTGKAANSSPDERRKIELLSNENAELVGKIDRLQERLQVLERIATDPAKRTADEIEALREKN
jgi:RecA/RadA recombinase